MLLSLFDHLQKYEHVKREIKEIKDLYFSIFHRNRWDISDFKAPALLCGNVRQQKQRNKICSDQSGSSIRNYILYLLVQVNLCQKLLFLHQLTHNMMTDCSLNYKFNTWKFQAQTWGEHDVYRNCFWHSEQFSYTTCSPHDLKKEKLLTKIYL